ncbi:Sialidase precursor [compost metagenome]
MRLDRVTASALRVNILDAKAGFVISTIEAYNAPTFVKEPQILRDKNGLVTIKTEEGNAVYYSLDGKNPSEKSTLYKTPFIYNKAVEIKAISRNTKEKINSAVKTAKYGVSKEKWKVISVSSGDDKSVERIIDGDANTDWGFGNDENKLPQSVVIDMGELVSIKGFTYTPQQVGNNLNLISNYELYTSVDSFYWDKQSEGEFSNIKHNPIEQVKSFTAVKARFLKFVATAAVGKGQAVSIAEIGVVE